MIGQWVVEAVDYYFSCAWWPYALAFFAGWLVGKAFAA